MEDSKPASTPSTGQNGAVSPVEDHMSHESVPPPRKGARKQAAPRKRVSQACNRCRSRKDKCNGAKPQCSTCAALNKECSYDQNVKKRGLPEGYVRGLEKLWGLGFSQITELEPRMLKLLEVGPDGKGFQALASLWNDDQTQTPLPEIWRKSQVSRELERLLPIFDRGEERVGKRRRLDGEFRQEDDAEGGRQPSEQAQVVHNGPPAGDASSNAAGLFAPQTDGSKVPAGDFSSQAAIPVSQAESSIDNDDPATSELNRLFGISQNGGGETTASDEPVSATSTLPSRAWLLLDIWFSYTHCWFPIIEKHDLLKVCYQYARKGLFVSSSSAGSGDYAALLAVLAYADYQSRALERSLLQPIGDSAADISWSSEKMYSRAKMLIPDEDEICELGHVQALLILALLRLGQNQPRIAWLLVGKAIRIAIDRGLNLPAEEVLGTAQSVHKSRNNHTFLGCFFLETMVAAKLERRPFLRKEDLGNMKLAEEGLEQWDPWVDCLDLRSRYTGRQSFPNGSTMGPREPSSILSTFNGLVGVSKILNDLLQESSTGIAKIARCQELLRDLHAWSENPSQQEFVNIMSGSQSPSLLLPHQVHFTLSQICTFVALKLAIQKEQLGPPDNQTEMELVNSARRAVGFLKAMLQDLGSPIAPPTNEYFISVVCQCAERNPVGSPASAMHAEWAEEMSHLLAVMGEAWPSFKALKGTLSNTAFDHPSYRTPGGASGLYTVTPLSQFPSVQPSDALNGIRRQSILGGHMPKQVPNTSDPLNGPSPPSASMFYKPATIPSPFTDALTVGTGSESGFTPKPNSGRPQSSHQSMAKWPPNAKVPQTTPPDIDGDSTFNEFATLDAMEWCVFPFPFLPLSAPPPPPSTFHSPIPILCLLAPTKHEKLTPRIGQTTGTNLSPTSASPTPST